MASLAGVQRHTVYRHFPTEEDLFSACSTEYWQRNPWPDLTRWQEIPSPNERAVGALGDLYRFYDAVEAMLTNVLRDGDHIPGIRPSVDSYEEKIDAITQVLIALLPRPGRPPDSHGRGPPRRRLQHLAVARPRQRPRGRYRGGPDGRASPDRGAALDGLRAGALRG
ncbi:TetR/AcrR family transcriptional regulator [Streptomyces kaempferi]